MRENLNELISVILPVYNAEKYIEVCIRSILNQTYNNFELILINDGSKDSSLKICKAFEEKDERIKVYDKTNGGASAARNIGLKQMKGKYVIFVDSDDYVSENYLENLYLAAKSGDYDIVQCNLFSTCELMKNIPTVSFQQSDVREITKKEALNARLYKVSVCGKIYSSHIFKEFQFKEGIIYEDDASYYIFVDRAERIALLNETLYYYYMSDNSVMRNNQKDKSTAFIGIYEDRIKYFSEKHDQVLLDGTYDRYCLVLMLIISNALKYGNNVSDIERFIDIYRKYYPYVMKSKYIGMKDKMMFFSFRLSPKIVGRIIGKIRC